MSQDAMADDGLDIGIQSSHKKSHAIPWFVSDTWWKSLSYFMRVGGQNIERYRIETKDDVKSAEQFINTPEIVQFGRFELWKAGVLNFGAWVASLDFNSWANRGRRFVFYWDED